MRLLLDTHAFLWFIGGDERLSGKAKEAIADLENEVFLSVASLWEIAVKINIGKLKLPRSFGELIPEQLMQNEITLLRIELSHLTRYVDLPIHHRDPFDRLIVVQAQMEEMPLVSKDVTFGSYDVDLLW
jgi:PIN domain nuclease of toxin-antitoxin system